MHGVTGVGLQHGGGRVAVDVGADGVGARRVAVEPVGQGSGAVVQADHAVDLRSIRHLVGAEGGIVVLQEETEVVVGGAVGQGHVDGRRSLLIVTVVAEGGALRCHHDGTEEPEPGIGGHVTPVAHEGGRRSHLGRRVVRGRPPFTGGHGGNGIEAGRHAR